MTQERPIKLVLPNETVAKLRLPYQPMHWPDLFKFEFQGGFSIQEPWEGSKDKPWNSEATRAYDALQKLIAPHQEKWIEADCVAALIPDHDGQNFSVAINGITLASSMYEAPGLRRRMLLKKMPILVTTCGARIFGGGLMPHGKKRGYGIGLDLKPFSR